MKDVDRFVYKIEKTLGIVLTQAQFMVVRIIVEDARAQASGDLIVLDSDEWDQLYPPQSQLTEERV